MTAIGHVAAASLFRGHPALRIAWGFVSHAALDYAVDEYRPKRLHLTDPRTWWAHGWWLSWQCLAIVLFWVLTRDPMAIVYGMLPDLIEAVYIKIKVRQGDNVWMSGKLLFPWHRAGRKFLVRLGQLDTILFEAVLLLLVVATHA